LKLLLIFSVLFLDEIDALCNGDQQVLYRLFEWASSRNQSKTQLCLIAVANAIDLTNRLLPRLKSKNCKEIPLNSRRAECVAFCPVFC
jgi:cell division control protein 6